MTEAPSLDQLLPADQSLYNLAEVAKLFQRTTRTVLQWERDGLLRATRVAGGPPLFARADVLKLIEEGFKQPRRGWPAKSRRRHEVQS